MTITARRYERRGLLAINPSAFFDSFFVDEEQQPENQEAGNCVVVTVRGPLEQRAHFWCDSYEAILRRVQAACETSARAVVLCFDSPGGDVQGCFDTAVAIRAACEAARKELHAYVEGECASAAYALASQCQSITISTSSIVGSIGVLSSRDDVSAMNASRGLRVALVTSGARKADGHPDQPITDAELESTQAIVDSMAQVFFDLVAQGRGLRSEAVAQLQARVFHGVAAMQAGLADAMGSLTTVLANAASPEGTKSIMAKKMSYEELRAVIAEAAEGDDPNAKAAKRALAAMDESPAPAAEGGESEETAEGGESEETAEGETPETDEPKPKPKPGEAAKRAAAGEEEKTAKAAYRIALKAQTEAAGLRAELRTRDEAAERQTLIASRPDLAADTVSLLTRAPIDLVREHIAGLAPLKAEAGAGGLRNPRVTALAGKPTVGNVPPGTASQLPPDEKAALDARMGLTQGGLQVVSNEYKLTLGAFKQR
jgi:ClpP class serine protease